MGGSSERHPSLPGVRWFKGYHTALSDMWLGAVQVVLLIILAAAIPRGVTVFLVAYIAFLLWDAGVLVIYLLRNRTWARLAGRSALGPIALLRQVESDRFVPAYPDDIESLNRGDNPGVELMYARTVSLAIWESSIFVVWLVLLWLIASNWPGLAATISLVWLISIVVRIALDYRLGPQMAAT